MYSAVLPSYDDIKGDKKDRSKVINADDPRNRESVRKELYG